LIGCIILAGGISGRGKDSKDDEADTSKAFVLLGERPLVEHVLDTVRKFFGDIVIVVKSVKQKADMDKLLKRTGASGIRVIADNSKTYSPIAGIKAGVECMSEENLFVVGCDMPFVNGVTIFRLMNRVKKDVDCVVPSSGGRHEPLCAIYSRNLFEGVDPKDDLEGIINKSRKILVPVFDKNTFFNVNTKDDLAKAERMLKESKRAAKENE
jgi:molybdenum cofactor guanylyltransferase